MRRSPPGTPRRPSIGASEANEGVTPIGRARINSCPGETKGTPHRAEEFNTAKRPRDEGDADNSKQQLRRGMDRLTRTISELVFITDMSSKTKNEIKVLVQKLKRLAMDVNKEWRVFEEEEITKKATVAIETKTVGVQVDLQEMEKERQEGRKRVVNKIQSALEADGGFESLAEILDEKWPQEVYKVTVTEGANQTAKIGQSGDYAILMDPKKAEYNKLEGNLMLRYAGLAELIKNNDGQPDFLIQTSNTRTRSGVSDGDSSAVHLLPLEIDPAGVNDMATVYDKIVRLKENIPVHPTERINLVISEGLKFTYIRKICEYVFAKETMTIKLIAQGQRSDPQKPKLRKKEESTVTIKTEGKSFVDVVKTLKAEVDIDRLGVKVKRLQKTEKGDIRLVIEGGQDMATSLQNEVKRKVDDVQVVTGRTGTTTIFVLGIDPTTTEADIKQALAREMKIKETEVIIKATRIGKREEQTMIAEVPRAQAVPLIKSRKLKMGWTECGIRERVDITRCFRCLEYGHKTRECVSQTDRSKDCIKCGETGHKGKDCVNRERCIRCGTEGHRADQIKCPYFKKLVEETRKQKLQPSGSRTNRP